MSGIFGIVHRDGRPVDPHRLERMRDTMAHRGPDGGDLWLSGPAGLGQLMLHTTTESLNESLPFADPASGVVVTADARIDNRDELADRLGRAAIDGIRTRMDSGASESGPCAIPDSQFVLEAYLRWGRACPEYLLGDFAFAIWDPRHQRLFCARDHMGLRPFFYFVSDSLFVFASSALGVASSGLMPAAIREERIADYMAWEMEGVDKVCTFFDEILRMPPAHQSILTGGEYQQRAYWQPDTHFELRLGSDDEYVEAFSEVLTRAVDARLRSHRPVASMLSGGLDSSTIVGIARNLQRDAGGPPFATFSGVSEPGEACRETRYSGRVIDQGGLEATRLTPSQLDTEVEALEPVEQVLEDPFEAGWILHRLIYLSARSRGHRVVMDGVGGESTPCLTSMYPVFLARDGRWLQSHRELYGMWKHYHRRTIPLWWKYRDLARATLVPEFARRLKRRLLKSGSNWLDDEYLLSLEYAEAHGLRARLEDYRGRKSLMECANLRETHARQLTMPYLVAGTERYGRMAAACGIENRQPLQDVRLVNFCLSLPWNQLVRGGWSKFILRRAAERVLPKDVAWRTGWDEVMWKFWSRWGDLKREAFCRILRSRSGRLAPMLDRDKLQERWNRYNAGGEVEESLFNLVNILCWLEQWDNPGKR